MKAVVYTRVSSEQQIGNTSLDEQEKVCHEFARRSGLEVIKLFKEEGESAKFIERTKLQEAIKFCNNRKNAIEVFLVYKYDRFSRNLENHLFIKAMLSARGIKLVSATEPITDSPSGRLQENILAAFAQFDNEVRTERTIAGLRSKLQQGHWHFIPPPGYMRLDHQVVPDPKTFPIVKQAWIMARSGNHTIKDLVTFLNDNGVRNNKNNPITIGSASKTFRNPFYVGKIISKKLGVNTIGHHQPMISEEDFALAQRMLNNKKTYLIVNHMSNNPVFYLNRMIRCENCGYFISGSYSKGKYGYYRCRNHKCDKRTQIKKEELEVMFMDLLHKHTFAPEFVKVLHDRIAVKYNELHSWKDKEIEHTTTQVKKVEERLKKSRLMLLDGHFSQEEYEDVNQELKGDLAALQTRLSNAKMTDYEAITVINMAAEYLQHLPKYWIGLPSKAKQRLSHLIFPKGVIFENGQLTTREISPLLRLQSELEDGNSPRLPSWIAFCNSIVSLFSSQNIAGSGT